MAVQLAAVTGPVVAGEFVNILGGRSCRACSTMLLEAMRVQLQLTANV